MNGWNPQFRIQGQVCHLIDPLEPADEMQARFLQIYFMERNQQIQRSFITDGLCNSIFVGHSRTLFTVKIEGTNNRRTYTHTHSFI